MGRRGRGVSKSFVIGEEGEGSLDAKTSEHIYAAGNQDRRHLAKELGDLVTKSNTRSRARTGS